MKPYLILFLGANWWGSDARALAVSLREQGHTLIELNYEDYLPTRWSSFPLRVVRRLIRPLCSENFNRAVEQCIGDSALDFVLAFKGMLLQPETLAKIRRHDIRAYCFYPDVSFADHGQNIAACLPLYDCVFTTKRFHVSDTAIFAKARAMQLVRHGFDPAVHRPLSVSQPILERYGCDVSFVGCWSTKKEGLVSVLARDIPGCATKIWGTGWNRANSSVRARWMQRGAYGDELAMIYAVSKINLGLLSEAGSGTETGDQVTARTWQIPASGGFLLHESTAELADYFIPDQEVGTFDGSDDLSKKVEYYLAHANERGSIAEAGHRRCLTGDYTYAAAAKAICRYHENYPTQGRC